MFNRSNFSSPFGGRPSPREGYSNPNQAPPPYPPRKDPYDAPLPGAGYAIPRPSDYDILMTDVHNDQRGYGAPRPGQMPMPMRSPVGGRSPGGGQVWSLRPAKSPDNTYTFGNLYVGFYPVY